MSCAANIKVSSSTAVLVSASGNAVSIITATSPDISLQLRSSSVNVQVSKSAPVVIEVCKQGPQGPPGASADNVVKITPDLTLTYDLDSKLTRVDYEDGRYKTFAYDGDGKLVTVVIEDVLTPQTVTKTLAYDLQDRLASVDVEIV